MLNNKFYKILFTSLFAISVASCGNDNTTSGSDSSFKMEFDTSKEVEIMFYHTMGDNLQKVLEIYLDDFKQLYPNITVNHRQIGTYDDISDQLVTEISSGSKDCDIAYVYPDHIAKYNKANVVLDLKQFMNDTQTDENGNLLYGMSQSQIDDFVDAYYNEGFVFEDDRLFCLPFSKSTEVLYYDKTFFEVNKLEVPTHWFSTGENDTTSMEYVCSKIKTIDPDCIPLGYDSESNWFITMAEQLGSKYTTASGDTPADHYLFDNALNRSFVQNFKNWYDKGYVTTKGLYGAYTSGLFTADITKPDVKTRSYMCIGSSAGATYQRPAKKNGEYPWEVGIATIPQSDLEDGKVISQGPSVSIFDTKDNQKIMASWLLVRFLTTNVSFQCQFSMESGYTPVLESCYDNEIYKDFLDNADGKDNIAALSTKVCVEQSDMYFTSPAFIGSSEAREEVGNLMVAVMSGTKSVDEAFKEAIAACIAG